ncbi:hypothetical protein GCG54_00009467 [Colletotrichum gloeosporioides]|uniref:SMP-30/Gluconolactonase/LRE-like region domain-containing protein n=1 Tax=Colletotrichum gloeosporioides TaxID=474922 RepID=A0A8H4FGE2_COLGL|nr:uncharacterized protein GCG54_00009467 [Colletotrichum gloeosporioides]KAF3800796.1 hypothetical protein GCG54_00009467 [Colletotrichum gloeosporioides]
MATVKATGIKPEITPIEIRDRRNQAPPGYSQPSKSDVSVIQYDSALESIIGSRPTHALLLSSAEGTGNAFFHRGCVYNPSRNELWTTSAPLAATDPSRPSTILMSKVTITASPRGDSLTAEWAKLRPPPAMPMPANGCLAANGILWCSQGTMHPGTGGVFHMPAGQPPKAVATTYYGRDFNSPHSAAVSGDGVWFTDPCCGHELDFRSPPQLPPSVYRYDQTAREVRAMADGFVRPTGIAVDEASSTLYVADAGGVKADGSLDLVQPRSIYAFDIVKRGDAIFLANKRLFALARRASPLHLMCENGNVWAACGDGIEIWNNGGSLLGLIKVAGTVTTMIDMKRVRWSSIVLVLIWAFSPLGGQAALRVLLKKPEAVVSFAELPYLDVNTSFPAQYIGSNIGNAQLPINSLVYSALGASEEVRQSSQDTSGNVKIPMVEPLLGRHSTKADEWITLDDEDRASIIWSSLIGIPFGNISRTGRTSFNLETSYLKMDCPIFEESEDASKLVVDGGLDCTIPINGQTFNCTTLTSWGGLSTTPYPDGRTNGTRRRCIDPTASARDFHYFDWSPAKDEPTYAKCKINSTYVETHIACDGYDCTPTAIRSSVSPRNPSANFTFFDSCQSENELASLYFQNLFKSLTDPTNRQKSPSIIQTYIVDPDKGLNATAVFDLPRAIHAGRENFEIRMAQLLNTYWLATIASEPLVLGHPENDDMLSYRNTVHATNFTSTNATVFTPITVLRYNATWMVILIISVVVLFTAAIAGLLIDFGVWVPKLLLNINSWEV